MPAVAVVSALSLLLGTLHGTVVRGPTKPVCIATEPCMAPAKHLTLLFTRNGKTARTTTDLRGRYRIRLAPGTYSVTTSLRTFGHRPQPGAVRVRSGVDRRVDLSIDTGIR